MHLVLLPCWDHELYGHKTQSFPPNQSPKMRESLCGLRRVSKEFQHPAIQTRIVQHFGGFFIK